MQEMLEGHPLMLMVREEAKTLLNHPLSLVLLRSTFIIALREIHSYFAGAYLVLVALTFKVSEFVSE